MGWLEGIEPSITGPQPAVLPLHHSHHEVFCSASIAVFGHFGNTRRQTEKYAILSVESYETNPRFRFLSIRA